MTVRRLTGLAAAALATAFVLVGVQASSAAAAAEPAAPRTVYYDDSRAGVWRPHVAEATQIWNASVTNVRYAPAGPGIGRCEDLMSGGSAPPTCGNAHPNPAESAEVNRIWQNARVGAPVSGVSARDIALRS
jgi:hypothetical protein